MTPEKEIDIVAVLKLPLPIGAFTGALKGLQADYPETLYIRPCADGYEVFKYRKQANALDPTGV